MAAKLVDMVRTEVPSMPVDQQEWPPCLRLCCLPPVHLFKGATAEATRRFVGMLLQLFCRRMGRERLLECLFDKPGGTPGAFPYAELLRPKPRPRPEDRFVMGDVPSSEWRWEPAFREALLSWLRELQWEPGMGQVTFVELALDFEAHSGRAMPASPGGSCRRWFCLCMRERECSARRLPSCSAM